MNDNQVPEPLKLPTPGTPPSSAYHRAHALKYLHDADATQGMNAPVLLQFAQVHATLALVAQNEEARG